MRLAQAIKTGFLRSFQFSGRASRSEFWWFAPIAFLPGLIMGMRLDWLALDFWGVWRLLLLMLISLPLLAGMSRRLQDTGEPGHQAAYPFVPLALLWVGYQMIFWFSLFTAPFIIGLLVGWFALILLMPLYIFSLFASAFTAASVIGMMLVASQPGPNRYGPNPTEVQS